MLIYVAGPMSKGPLELNIRSAMDVGRELFEVGAFPVIPHLYCFFQIVHSRGYEDWMRFDFELIKRCDGLFRMDGYSPGADREVEFAKQRDIPVFYHVEKVKEYIVGQAQVQELAPNVQGMESPSL